MDPLTAATREAIERKGIRHKDLAISVHRHPTWLSHWINGRGRNDPEVVRDIADRLDCPQLWMALHEATASCVFVYRWLDGENVDLHRSSVKAKAIEELAEAIETLKRWDLVNKPQSPSSDAEREEQLEKLFQLMDAGNAVNTAVAVLCEELGISPKEAFARFNKRLEAKGYQQRRRSQ